MNEKVIRKNINEKVIRKNINEKVIKRKGQMLPEKGEVCHCKGKTPKSFS